MNNIRRSVRRVCLAGLAIALLQACASPDMASRHATATAIAGKAALLPAPVEAGAFTLAAFQRIDSPGQPLVVYLEGDGLAWASRTRPSDDPTPVDPVALRLAAADGSANVAWLARPCQYRPRQPAAACRTELWTTHRLAEEVVAATHLALDALKRRAGSTGLHLVVFSGGGGLAVLVAAERDDVLSLRSVAGNLDTDAFTRHHRVSPMHGSRNPAGVARRIARIPQVHYVGSRDTVVPRPIFESFRRSAGDDGACMALALVDAAHGEGWDAAWATLSHRIPACRPRQASSLRRM